MHKIIGLDLSLSSTGWAIWKDGAITCDVITTPTAKTLAAEVLRIETIVKQVAELARGSDLAVIEDFAFSRNANGARAIGAVGYMLRLWLLKQHIPFLIVGTGQLRKFVTGSGKSGGEKGTMIREVYRRWGIVADDHNVADACGLLHIGLAAAKQIDSLTGFQQEILESLRKRNSEAMDRL